MSYSWEPLSLPAIDMIKTGKNITRLCAERGVSAKMLQKVFGFTTPQAVYKWQRGASLPSIDNLVALSAILDVPIEAILVISE